MIRVTAVRNGNRAVFTVEDDGTGMPEKGGPGNPPGFGLELVGILVKQMKGTLRVGRDRGTRCILDRPL